MKNTIKINWAKSVILRGSLLEPFESSRAHLVLTVDNAYFDPKDPSDEFQELNPSKNRLQTTWRNEDEKIFIIQYGSLLKPLPSVYCFNPFKDSVHEVGYNRISSEASSIYKKHMFYDKLTS